MGPAAMRMIYGLLIILFMTGCKKNYVINNKQEILFQFEYINNTTGNQHSGFIIDDEGNVLAYSNPTGWNFPDNELSLNQKQVAENISKCVPTGKKISEEELLKYSRYIKNIASSKVTALKDTKSEIGSLEFTCYQYSPATGKYYGSLIKKEGNTSCENLNFYSKKVVLWMREINNSLIEK
ncbi:MAG TPA: hypothetical protein PLR88_03925 [Bacteroidales bacterium]|nr:hypothetical protein [Bacteroidales bacterium]